MTVQWSEYFYKCTMVPASSISMPFTLSCFVCFNHRCLHDALVQALRGFGVASRWLILAPWFLLCYVILSALEHPKFRLQFWFRHFSAWRGIAGPSLHWLDVQTCALPVTSARKTLIFLLNSYSCTGGRPSLKLFSGPRQGGCELQWDPHCWRP